MHMMAPSDAEFSMQQDVHRGAAPAVTGGGPPGGEVSCRPPSSRTGARFRRLCASRGSPWR